MHLRRTTGCHSFNLQFQDVIPYLDLVASELYGEHHPSTDDVDVHVEVRPFNADITRNMRSLDPNGEWGFINVTVGKRVLDE